ncbi:MAG TPA: dihydroorotate dehydrogenase [Candidatus Altiarchaeales archaeon]|nr:dihydroorotate dehydrogenase [Candidatus Altiarchaeales archaeon]
MTNLSTSITGIKLKNPTILTSGILGSSASIMLRVANSGVGAVTTKSIGPTKRSGHKNPVIVETPCGLLNAIGLSCPSLNESLDELKNLIKNTKVPVIASIYAKTVDEFAEVAERVSDAKPDFLEINISCPNIENEFGKPFGTDPEISSKITEIVKNSTRIPVIVKLTPNVTDIRKIAKVVEDSGADVISAINTYGPGMIIDIETAKPILSNKSGGLSGPAIRPIAVRCVYEIYETVEIPVIGTGGIESGRDAIEMIMAGASAVGVGTAVMNYGIDVFAKICKEIEEFMNEQGYSNIDGIIGRVHG